MKAEGLFRKILDMLEDSDSYNKVLCLQLYGKMLKKLPKRENEGKSNNLKYLFRFNIRST